MNRSDKMTFADKIKWRIRFLRLTLAAMLIYMVAVGETGGDSRVLTDFDRNLSNLIFFGGLFFIGYRIFRNKKLLNGSYS